MQNIEISEEDFFNKVYCDALRDIVENSPAGIKEAQLYLSHSKYIEDDTVLIKKLANGGVSHLNILLFISIINS